MRLLFVAVATVAFFGCSELVMAQGATGNITLHKIEAVGKTTPPCSGDFVKATGVAEIEIPAGVVDSVVFKIEVKAASHALGPYTLVASAATARPNLTGYHTEVIPLVLAFQTDASKVYIFEWTLMDGTPAAIDSESIMMWPCIESGD